ncbi:MAG: hypothetical protein KDB68_04165 [Planctomycetes bacterium]|nr:hypothetical protein [Planctomycetota bacterium]MCA8935378.1 hypothetical protein [Planctomycetota bacterium]
MPHFQKTFEAYKDKGVSFFAVEGDGLTKYENQAFAGEWGYTFPIVTLADSKLSGYDMVTMPIVFVINSFGRVVFQGNGDYEKYIESSLEDLKYPYLGKDEVVGDAEKAAEAFGKGEYAKAKELANELLSTEPGDDVAADAKYIVARTDSIASDWQAKIDAMKGERRFDEATTYLEKLADHFKGSEIGDKADEELKALKKDKDAKAESKARASLAKTLAANKKMKTKEDKLSALYKFYEKNEGTAAADDAKAMAEAIKNSSKYK